MDFSFGWHSHNGQAKQQNTHTHTKELVHFDTRLLISPPHSTAQRNATRRNIACSPLTYDDITSSSGKENARFSHVRKILLVCCGIVVFVVAVFGVI